MNINRDSLFSKKMSDDTFDRIILNLKVLGSISEQDRVYSTNHGLDVGSPKKWDCIYRWYYKEDRAQNIKDVKDVIDTAFTLSESLLSEEEALQTELSLTQAHVSNRRQFAQKRTQQKLGRLKAALREASVGMRNWINTYKDDVKTQQSIQTLASNIDDHLAQLELLNNLPLPNVCPKCRNSAPTNTAVKSN